jgi:recombination DNA repair RAD52 pathway protein
MRKWSEIVKDLREPLDLDRVKTRSAGGGVTIPYLEGDDVINTANRIFDEDGWDAYPLSAVERFEVGSKHTDHGQILIFVYSVPYMVRFHGLLADGSTVHTIEKGDIGKNSTQSEAFQQHEMAISGCATDALKRAMRHLGRQFGITLYDKEHDDFKAAVSGNKPAKKTKAQPKKKKKAAPKKAQPKKEQATTAEKSPEEQPKKKETGIQRALGYVIPEELEVDGKPVRLPNSGKNVGEVLEDPMGEALLTWLAGLRVSPAQTPPFVAQTEDEIALQNAVSYVLLNKSLDALEEDEVKTLKGRLQEK